MWHTILLMMVAWVNSNKKRITESHHKYFLSSLGERRCLMLLFSCHQPFWTIVIYPIPLTYTKPFYFMSIHLVTWSIVFDLIVSPLNFSDDILWWDVIERTKLTTNKLTTTKLTIESSGQTDRLSFLVGKKTRLCRSDIYSIYFGLKVRKNNIHRWVHL